MAALKPALQRWGAQKPIALPGTPAGGRGGAGVGTEDVLVESDRERQAARPPPTPDEDDDEEAADDDRARTRRPTRPPPDDDDRRSRERRPPTLDDEPAAPRPRVDDAPPPRRVVEEAPRRERAALDDGEDETLTARERRSLADVEGAPDGPGPVKPSHLVAVAASFAGTIWHHSFDGNDNVQPQPVTTEPFPGGALRFDLWPFPWLGLDVTGGLSGARFQMNNPERPAAESVIFVLPDSFVSWRTKLGAAAKARALLRFGDDGALRLVGLGLRAGYRYWAATVESQVIRGTTQRLTVVPGFGLHTFAVGPEVYLPLFVADRRFEIELKADVLPPWSFYSESPDNPGRKTFAVGYHAELLARFDISGGFFAELAAQSTGLTVNYEGDGDRVTTVPNSLDLAALKGGRVWNIDGALTLGVGFFY
jgi:hypothetical protein